MPTNKARLPARGLCLGCNLVIGAMKSQQEWENGELPSSEKSPMGQILLPVPVQDLRSYVTSLDLFRVTPVLQESLLLLCSSSQVAIMTSPLNQTSIFSVHSLVFKEKLSPPWPPIAALGSGYRGGKVFPGGSGSSPQAPSFGLGCPSLLH